MPKRSGFRRGWLDLPSMQHSLLYRFVPGAYTLNRQPSGIRSRPISRVEPARPKGLRPRESPIAPRIYQALTHNCLCPYNDGDRQDSFLMTASKEPTVLLALDARVRETVWAVFKATKSLKAASLDYQLDARWSRRSGSPICCNSWMN